MQSRVKFYNTLNKEIQEFTPIEDNKVKMYTCGPTVYHFAHIGNLRTYIMEDVLERFLVYAGYDVTRAMNITDVGHLSGDSDDGEDKMLKGAQREKKTVMEIAEFYTEKFFADCNKLNIKKPEIIDKATDCIDEYIIMIEKLLKDEYAYISEGNIYFDTSKIQEYYKLVGHSEDNLHSGVREGVEEDKNKKNKGDFVLWFTKSKFDKQELRWESPWGVGYPGWHLECSAISMKHLGDRLDIHCGGVDNIFPHHTNEIAQSEAYVGHKWCNYWFHVQHLNTNTGKMSKSKGEFLTLDLLEEKGYDPLAYRYFCLQSHYRKPLVFSYENLDNGAVAFNKLKERISKLKDDEDVNQELLEEYRNKFIEVVGNDLNTSMGITMVYDVLKLDCNDTTKKNILLDFDRVLALNLDEIFESSQKTVEISDDEIEKQINLRAEAKKNKDFATADKIRDELKQMGIVLKDTKEGTTWTVE